MSINPPVRSSTFATLFRRQTSSFPAVALLAATLACADAGESIDPATAEAARPAATGDAAADPRVAAADAARILGSDTASVWVIDISDFQCPFCKVWHDRTFAQLREEFIDSGKVRFAYVNMPLRMHPHSREASNYAMCAGAQGRFFEYAEQLFATQEQWSELPSATAVFDSLSTVAGVDASELSRCVADGVMEGLVSADYERAVQTGVRSTPSFIVGNQRLEGVQSIENLRVAIEAAMSGLAAPR